MEGEFGRSEHRSSARPQVVRLNGETASSRVFFLTGIGLYDGIAQGLNGNATAYGVYIPEDPHAVRQRSLTVPDLARAYVELIATIQPHGPYHLAGFSFGGLVAFEVAQQFRARGEQVGLLALIDAFVPRVGMRGAMYTLRRIQGLTRRDISTVFHHYLPRNPARKAAKVPKSFKPKANPEVEAAHRAAALRYTAQIRDWPKPVTVISSGYRLTQNPMRGADCSWACYLSELDVYRIETTHHELLHGSAAAQVADTLLQRLQLEARPL